MDPGQSYAGKRQTTQTLDQYGNLTAVALRQDPSALAVVERFEPAISTRASGYV
jgi:hypothetical protein